MEQSAGSGCGAPDNGNIYQAQMKFYKGNKLWPPVMQWKQRVCELEHKPSSAEDTKEHTETMI
jgi:hypothetical protein